MVAETSGEVAQCGYPVQLSGRKVTATTTAGPSEPTDPGELCNAKHSCRQSYNRNLWIDHLFGGVTYLPH
jgi:hypothetical protein